MVMGEKEESTFESAKSIKVTSFQRIDEKYNVSWDTKERWGNTSL